MRPALILGRGQVGMALSQVLRDAETWDALDGDDRPPPPGPYEFLHVCYGYHPGFEGSVSRAAARYLAGGGIVVVHSTVPAGTTRKCWPLAAHSPVHGKHPDLRLGLLTFPKLIGATSPEVASAVSDHFSDRGMVPLVVSSPEAAELSKRWCLRQYAMAILVQKLCAEDCDAHGVPFDEVYTLWNRAYNEGWQTQGQSQYVRPVLRHEPGPIGGHCVLQNSQHTPEELIDRLILELADGLDKRNAARHPRT